ncbi:ABC transporter substrate-binding protein [Streptococcus gallinaceus]|uniref:Aldouronate transport system substrate-binding protein n=1 Tax=Streptococcus gallinaceus TaxID=165758 RepID=A0ABV2JM16_9STRE|nr:ABC transporter substrate-binding protein [Streptococcus gallinaceus]MCP1639847.1 putative aldouronate transport system substrate-binding protein [Streptococcus gallinaceus]MCP1770781.1 putative aldouronate transport system substrate-binding protein [Streptococcus gallinaceus]
MKKWQRLLCFAGTALAATSLVACGSGKSASTEKGGNTKLLMYQIGEKPDNFDKLMEIANKRIKEKTGATIDMQYIGWGEWGDKMSTIIASGESYDIAYAYNYVVNAQKGAFADLTDLMPKYAKETYDNLEPAYIQGNLVNGKLYAFPVDANVYAQQMLSFNKKFLDKYNLDISGIKSYADAEPILKAFHEKEPNVAAFAIGQVFNLSGDYDYPLNKNNPFAVKVDAGKATIINPYAEDSFKANLRLMHKWYQEGLIPSDAATNTEGYPLDGDTWFMREETQGPMDYGDTILTNAAGKEIVSRPLTKALKTTSQAQMANFVVSNASKNKEKAVEVLALLNSDPELLNGLVYGVEGEAWEKVGDKKIKLLDGYKPGTHMSAWNTGNNKILYTQESITDEMIAKRDQSIKDAAESPILGFAVNTDSIKTELSNISNVMNRYKASLNTGTVDPDATLPKFLSDLKDAGWDKVQAELQKQLDEFVAHKK